MATNSEKNVSKSPISPAISSPDTIVPDGPPPAIVSPESSHAIIASGKDAGQQQPVTRSPHRDDVGIVDVEKQSEEQPSGWWTPQRKFWAKIVSQAAGFILMTVWLIVGLLRTKANNEDRNTVVPVVFYVLVILRQLTLHLTQQHRERLFNPLGAMLARSRTVTIDKLDKKWHSPLGGAVVAAAILIGTFTSPASPGNELKDRAVSLLGFTLALFGLWISSKHRKHVQWRPVVVGVLGQFLLGVFVMRSQTGRDILEFVAQLANTTLGFSKSGMKFLLSGSEDLVDNTTWFLLNVGPPIIFFVAAVSILSYWGVTQWIVGKFAAVFFYTMRISGAEAVVAASSPFLGIGEAVVLIKPWLIGLTDAEMHQVQASGYSTVAGSVLYAYMAMGVSGKVVLSSCVMSIPASLAASKLRMPETEAPLTAGRLVAPAKDNETKPHNALQVLADGTWLGLKVAGMVCSVVLVLISMVALIDGFLGWWGGYLGAPDLNLAQMLGYLMFPVAFLCGVSRSAEEIRTVGGLIGTKIVVNEFAAYFDLMNKVHDSLSPRSKLIAMYALCGFGNIGSVGIVVGVLTQLAPQCRQQVAKTAVSALVTGIIATLTSACIAGMLVTDVEEFLKT